MDVMDFVGKIYHLNSPTTARHHELCARIAARFELAVKMVIWMYVWSGVVSFSPAFYELYTTGRLAPIAYTYFVGYQEDNMPLWLALHAYNFAITFFGMLVYIATDLIVFAVFINIDLLSMIAQAEIQDFDHSLLAKEGKDDGADGLEKKYRLIRLIMTYGKYVE